MTSQKGPNLLLLLIWYYCWVPNVKEILNIKLGASPSIWTIFTACYFNLSKWSHKRRKIQEVWFSDIFNVFHMENITLVLEKKGYKLFLKSSIHDRIFYISKFYLLAQNARLPFRLKNHFHHREKVRIFWVFRTRSCLVSSKNTIVILLVQVPRSFYWSINYYPLKRSP